MTGWLRAGSLRQREPLRGRSRRSWLFDVAVALLVGAASSPTMLDTGASLALSVPALTVLVAALVVRRAWPMPVFVAGLALASSLGWFWPGTAVSPFLLVALYTVVTRCERSTGIVASVLLAVGSVGWAARQYDGRETTSVAVTLVAVVVATTVGGLFVQTRRRLLGELRDRAVRLELERDQQGELAAAAERARIAREMHDIVAHHLTVMIALADGAGAQAVVAPERARRAIHTVSATGREALADTRRLLGVLREPAASAARSPLPGLGDLDELVDGVRAAGLPVRFELDGDRAGLDPATQLALFRLVQEALTNIMKHAGPDAAARVRLAFGPREVCVEVVDDGAGASVPATDGRGLVGMGERLSAVGGELVAGPSPAGGWSVRARIPVGGDD